MTRQRAMTRQQAMTPQQAMMRLLAQRWALVAVEQRPRPQPVRVRRALAARRQVRLRRQVPARQRRPALVQRQALRRRRVLVRQPAQRRRLVLVPVARALPARIVPARIVPARIVPAPMALVLTMRARAAVAAPRRHLRGVAPEADAAAAVVAPKVLPDDAAAVAA
jgi:hypothetical protein